MFKEGTDPTLSDRRLDNNEIIEWCVLPDDFLVAKDVEVGLILEHSLEPATIRLHEVQQQS